VQEAVGSTLDGGTPILGKVLVLMIGLTLPVRDNQSTDNILDAITGLGTSTIANKFVHSSPFADDIFKSVVKLLIYFDTVNVRNQRGPSNKKLCSLNTTINSRGIAEDSVSGNRFMTTSNVACRKTRFPMLLKNVGYSPPSVLCSDSKGFLDSIGLSPSKERVEEIVILWGITVIKVVYLVGVFIERWLEGVHNIVNDVVKCEELMYIEECGFWFDKL
jgi:hypothetical protein